ncbi:hypothetical protein X971_5051 (plasmid) [Agrobacterium tumefaciens LBA4213 (Ach5)]|nr:hypothetical protein X971_5051 [Agrobacterium tumefaciens LBA4213 (Ach5)]
MEAQSGQIHMKSICRKSIFTEKPVVYTAEVDAAFTQPHPFEQEPFAVSQ